MAISPGPSVIAPGLPVALIHELSGDFEAERSRASG
jgi:hypothetical protein